MQVKTSELSGAALDWAVAKCEWFTECGNWEGALIGAYSTEWNYAGPIIERERIKVFPNIGGSWSGQIRHTQSHPLTSHPVIAGWTNSAGPSPLIAAMRCYVASKCGDTINVPDSLIGE